MNITILIITHEYGVNVYPCTTREIADAYLHDFVRRWWADSFGTDPMPTDPQEAIDEYFNSDLCDESYDITTDTLIETLPNQEVSA